ncbi:MAG: UpxY family transcription antiterminator [Roseivirga sp.]|nr:UpxY family transcription antiterminator [Roseivirga sp.]
MNTKVGTYWTAFYTKPRNEKKVAERLLLQGFEVYCPTITVVKQWSDRKKKVKEPVFSSYIFAHVNEQKRQQILMDPAIVSSVFWLKKPVHIRDAEIQAIKEFLDDFPQVKGAVLEIAPGDRAVITAGPLRGEEGVVRQKRGGKVLLQLYSLGLELQAEVSIGKLDTVK